MSALTSEDKLRIIEALRGRERGFLRSFHLMREWPVVASIFEEEAIRCRQLTNQINSEL